MVIFIEKKALEIKHVYHFSLYKRLLKHFHTEEYCNKPQTPSGHGT